MSLDFGFSTKLISNQSPQLQGLARKLNFACSKLRYDTFQKANNKGCDQSANLCRLVCAFAVFSLGRQVFSHQGPLKKMPILIGSKILIQDSLFITLCLGSIEMDSVISESVYNFKGQFCKGITGK